MTKYSFEIVVALTLAVAIYGFAEGPPMSVEGPNRMISTKIVAGEALIAEWRIHVEPNKNTRCDAKSGWHYMIFSDGRVDTVRNRSLHFMNGGTRMVRWAIPTATDAPLGNVILGGCVIYECQPWPFFSKRVCKQELAAEIVKPVIP